MSSINPKDFMRQRFAALAARGRAGDRLPCPRRTRLPGAVLLGIAVLMPLLPLGAAAKPADPGIDDSHRLESRHAIASGLDWLAKQQSPNGSWSEYPAVTGLALTAFLRSPAPIDPYAPAINKGFDYVLSCVQPDGGIYAGEPPFQNYNTSICLMALVASGNPKYDEVIRNARRFLIGLQCDEAEGFGPDSLFYGGIGYGDDGRPDLANLHWTLEALKASEDFAPRGEFSDVRIDEASTAAALPAEVSTGKGFFWDKALLFLQRCQNLSAVNDQDWASDDGGFVYEPGVSKAGGTTSYGSMTYAGMQSLIYAGLSRDDPRVTAAHTWIRNNYTLERNPELDQQGLYYYYQAFAKALNAYGDPILKDSAGREHRWREEYVVKLASLQHAEGYWVNAVGRWWENNPQLVTAYCILGLEETMRPEPVPGADHPADR